MSIDAHWEDLSLGRSLELDRRRIVSVALNRSVSPERQTVLADALCNRALDYLIKTIRTSDDEDIVSWISASLRGYAREQGLFGVFTSTVSAALDHLIQDFGSDSEVIHSLERLQHRIDVTVSASRLNFHEEHFALDSIDAKIDEVLFQLSERDTITAEHSRAVGMWCSRIAKKMSMSREETLLASRSGLIHDIGKVRTPLEILTAPRSLSDAEWQIMRRHTLDGVDAIESFPELQDFLPAVRWHHERMDGRGYPDGLDRLEDSIDGQDSRRSRRV